MKLLILGFMLQVFANRARGEVLQEPKSFNTTCSKFFIPDPLNHNVHYPPTVLNDTQNPDRYQKICQHWQGSYRYATLYDTKARIPVYSAYYYVGYHIIDNPDWKIEPQLDDPNAGPDMERENSEMINKGKNQAIYDDYRAVGYTRGHLFPRCHNNEQDCAIATFTHTNAVPQTQNVNNEWAAKVEKKMETFIKDNCHNGSAHVVTGAVPGQTWLEIKRDNVLVQEGVNVPDHFWTACCCQSKNINHTLWSAAWLGKRKDEDLEEHQDEDLEEHQDEDLEEHQDEDLEEHQDEDLEEHQDEDLEKRKDGYLIVRKKTVQQLEEDLKGLYMDSVGEFRIFGGLCRENATPNVFDPLIDSDFFFTN